MALGLISGGVAAGPAAAQTGSVTGTILDASTGQPLDAVQVSLERVGAGGTGLGGLTRETGRFLLINVPPGEYVVRAQLIGFGTQTHVVNVRTGESAAVDFRMTPEAISLSEIVVTGVIGATQRTKLPFDVAQVRVADLPVPSVNPATSLQGKVAGAQVVQPSGLPGSQASVLLRGVTSLNANGRSQDPLYIVDDVILGSGLVDLDALDIQSIDVVKGAAAASLYGSRAANGVIHIRTRRGAEIADDQVRYTLRSELGQSSLYRIADRLKDQTHPYALAESGTVFIDTDGTPCAWLECNDPRLAGQLAGDGPATVWNTYDTNLWPGRTYDQVGRFFTHGPFLQHSITAEGRTGRTNFHLSGTYLTQDGILIFVPGYGRTTFRANLDQAVRPGLTVQTSVFYSRASTQMWEWRGAISSIGNIAPIVDLLASDPDVPDELVLKAGPGLTKNPLYDMKYVSSDGVRSRFLGAATVRYLPRDWLTVDGNFSFDRSSEEGEILYPKGWRSFTPTPWTEGYLHKALSTTEAMNGSLTASARWNLAERFRNNTQLRYLVELQDYENVWTEGTGFAVENVPTFDGIDSETVLASSGTHAIRSDGVFVLTNFDLAERYVVDALLRNDGSSLFGADERRQWYYRLGGAWRISQEDFFNIPGVDELKLRYSVGTAGGRPRFEAQYETFDVNLGRISPVRLGNKKLKPEFSTEQEAGLDLSLFGYGAMVTLTYARTTTENQILEVPLPQLSGYLSQWRNAGTIESRTWEATLDVRLVQREALNWTARLLFDATRSEITALYVPDYKFGYNQAFFARNGERIGTFYGVEPARSCSDLPEGMSCQGFAVNNDGFLVWVGSERSFGDYWIGPESPFEDPQWGLDGPVIGGTQTKWGTPFVGYCTDRITGEKTLYCPLGNSIPDYNLGLSTQMSWRGLTAYALFTRSVGGDVWNLQTWVAESDQGDTPVEEQKPIGYYQAWYGMSTTGTSIVNGLYVEDGTFTKLRELALTYRVDPILLQPIPLLRSLKGLGLSVTGRNLFTWTDYKGFDPDTGRGGGATGSAVVARIDHYNYPPMRTWTFTLEVTF
jgi:TonB-linked SusC/RagA family outer membrane protein